MPMQTIVVMVILIAVVVIFIVGVLGPKGLLQKAGRSIGDIMGVLPDTDSKIELKQIPLDKDVRESANGIVDALIAAKETQNAPCIMKYKPADLKGYIMTFSNEGSNVQIFITTPDKQVADIRDVKDLKYNQGVEGVNVCVVAGEIYGTDITVKNPKGEAKVIASRVYDGSPSIVDVPAFLKFKAHFPSYESLDMYFITAQNFYTNWIQNIPPDVTELKSYASMRRAGEKIISPDYTNPTMITLTGSSTMQVAYGRSEPNDWEHEDGGLLYVPEKEGGPFVTTVRIWFRECLDRHW